ncbi:hypothetical protein, partial [Armatimonas sp.]|uniref:hypothetical protein n=1 Tax=Armatimonas sp. TaxID=1872638 RepID=UPI003750437E
MASIEWPVSKKSSMLAALVVQHNEYVTRACGILAAIPVGIKVLADLIQSYLVIDAGIIKRLEFFQLSMEGKSWRRTYWRDQPNLLVGCLSIRIYTHNPMDD